MDNNGTLLKRINFAKMGGLIPAVAQDWKTGAVLMVGFMNKEALEKSLREGRVSYWSRTRKRIWTKGEQSGNTQEIKEVVLDCDSDAVLIKVHQRGNVCHEDKPTCFSQNIYETEK